MKTYTIADVTLERDGNATFYINGKRISLYENKAENNLIPFRFFREENTEDFALEFSSADERKAFQYATANYIATMQQVRRFMQEWFENKKASETILEAVKQNHFFKQLSGVDLLKSTKAKLYGDKIYMNGVEVKLNDEEKEVFNAILKEADWYFANYEDTDVKAIKNSRIIGDMFRHYFPDYEQKPNRFSPTVPYTFNQIHNG